jgi:hypothetical protein
VDRGLYGSKHHVLTDAGGVLLAVTTVANTADVTEARNTFTNVPPVKGNLGRPKTWLRSLVADKACDS